jgi:hypothetical protein
MGNIRFWSSLMIVIYMSENIINVKEDVQSLCEHDNERSGSAK